MGVMNPWSYTRTLLSAPINTATSRLLISAPALPYQIKVYGWTAVAAAAVTLAFVSTSINAATYNGIATSNQILTGSMNFAANGGAAPSIMPPGTLFEANPGENLAIYLGGAVAVGGVVSYYVE